MSTPIIVGICGGSGCGKSWLARALLDGLGAETAVIVEQDWYYRDLSHLPPAKAASTNFDNPAAIEFDLLEAQLRTLAAGQAIEAPQYAFARFARLPERKAIPSRPVIIVEGLFILLRPEIRAALDESIYVETPSDICLIRRIRRDLAERGYSLEQILDFWENRAHPMRRLRVEPQRQLASRVWKSMEDSAFVPEFLADLTHRLTGNADRFTAPG